MERFDKAYKGLNCHVNGHPHTRCYKCPYWGTGPHGSSKCNVLANDALSLIRQQAEKIHELQTKVCELQTVQTARVMTLENVDTAEACMEPVFVEMLDENGKPGETPDIFSWRFVKHIMPLTDGKIYVLNNVGFSSALYEETYNITWRCWTQRPTFKQREATPWY